MVDKPDTLSSICLRKVASLLKDDEYKWKRHVEEQINYMYRQRKTITTSNINDQQKRKYHRGEPQQYHRTDEEITTRSMDCSPETQLPPSGAPLFLETFLRGSCSLNPILSERLAAYLVSQNQMNDFTISIFSSHTTCLKRLVLNIKYLSRLKFDILNQHPHLVELELIFKDPPSNRTEDLIGDNIAMFYRRICPAIDSRLDDIYTIYGPFIVHHPSRSQFETTTRTDSTNRYPLRRFPNSSDDFSHHKVLNGLLNNLHPSAIDRLKVLIVAHYKFFANHHPTAARKPPRVDMSPLTKCSASSTASSVPPGNVIPTNFRLILKFTNLTSLNLSGTDIKNHCLDLLVDSLTKLDTLDLSLCRSLTSFDSLSKLSTSLKWLNLYNCCFHTQFEPTIFEILIKLELLEYLDISDDTFHERNATTQQERINQSDSMETNSYDINAFLRHVNCLPRLKHLDISGQKNVTAMVLRDFLLVHPNLHFLGLFLTKEKYSPCVFDPTDPCYSKYRRYTYDLRDISTLTLADTDLTIYEPFLIEALTRYRDRSGFVQKILYYIFFLTRNCSAIRQNILIELILRTMAAHPHLQAVQMASTACIYNLTRSPSTEKIHVKCLANIVRANMNVMSTFPNQQQLQKNCLLTMCSDRILHEPNYEFYQLASLVMQNLQNYADLAILQPGVAILSLLTTRLTIDECTRLSTTMNLKRLLQLIEQQIDRLQTVQGNQNHQVVPPIDQSQQQLNDIDLVLNDAQQLTGDDTLRFCLSLLWNLTDENSAVCERFIRCMGLQLFQRLIILFASDTIVLTKLVGLLSNVAEVAHLKIHLYSSDIIPQMQRFLSEAAIDIAFSAGGILAHLLFDMPDDEIDQEFCQKMKENILNWENPDNNMVTYRSFKPFLPLLRCTRVPVVQLWAIWAIHHVCSTDRLRYARIAREEHLYELMQSLYEQHLKSAQSDPSIIELLRSVLEILKSYRRVRCPSSSVVAS